MRYRLIICIEDENGVARHIVFVCEFGDYTMAYAVAQALTNHVDDEKRYYLEHSEDVDDGLTKH